MTIQASSARDAMDTLDGLIQPIWEMSPFPIAVTGNDADPLQRTFRYANPAFARLTGYTAAELIGRPVTMLYGPRTDRAALRQAEEAVRKDKPFQSAIVHYRKDGSEYLCQATVAPLLEPDGSSHYLIRIDTVFNPLEKPGPFEAAPERNAAVVPLTLPMPLIEYPDGRLPKHLVSHPELDSLRALWDELRDGRTLPLRGDFTLDKVKRWAPHLSIVTALPDGRFQFRLFGSELARVYGRDLTGCVLSELTPVDLWSVVTMHYREVMKTKQPLFAAVSVSNGRWYKEVSRMLLPLGIDGDGVGFIMGADYPRDRW